MSTRCGRRFLLAGVTLALATGLFVAAASGGSERDGGVFRVAGVPDAIDPAITLDAGDALEASCAKLMTYPDAALPAGTRVEPEVATRYPAVSRDGRTYTFTVGNGFRFSTGERVTAKSFVRAMYRLLDPTTNSPWVQYVQDIVGAKDVIDGKATQASGIRVRSNKLIIQLTHAARDFPARVAFYGFCAVPVDLPISAEGVGASLPGAGPYYIADFVSGQRLVLRRNPFYRGSRPHHVDEIDFSPTSDSVAAVETGAADYAELGGPADLANLDPKYRPQLHSVPGIGVRYIVLNSSQPLLKDNVPLRQAVNFAPVDTCGLGCFCCQ